MVVLSTTSVNRVLMDSCIKKSCSPRKHQGRSGENEERPFVFPKYRFLFIGNISNTHFFMNCQLQHPSESSLSMTLCNKFSRCLISSFIHSFRDLLILSLPHTSSNPRWVFLSKRTIFRSITPFIHFVNLSTHQERKRGVESQPQSSVRLVCPLAPP